MLWLRSILVFALFFTCVTARLNLKRIFRITRWAIRSKNEKRIDRVLQNFYFTDKKDKSIWYHAQAEARAIFNIDLDANDLGSIEKGLQNLKTHYSICRRYSKNIRRALCYHKFLNLFEDGLRNFFWDYAPDIDRESKSKWGTLYLSNAAMCSLISAAINLNIDVLGEQNALNDWRRDFYQFFEHVYSYLYGYEKDITQWRKDQILAMDICEQRRLFWKEFPQTCETRWRRSVDEDDDGYDDEVISKRSGITDALNNKFEGKNITSVLTDEEDNLIDSRNNDPRLDVVDAIGGMAQKEKIYTGKIIDDVTKEVLFNEEIVIKDIENRGLKLMEMHTKGMEVRGKHQIKIENQMKKFNDGTSRIVRKILSLNMKQLEKEIGFSR